MYAKLATFALLLSASATPIRRAAPSLKVLTEAPSTVDTVENLLVKTTLTNTGSHPVEVNPYDTYLSRSETDDYVVDGTAASGKAKRPSFVGVYSKHVTDVPTLRKLGLLKTLAPGESIVTTNNLAGRYDMTPSGTGPYTIAAKAKFQVAHQDSDQFEAVVADVQPASVFVTGKLARDRTRRTKRDVTFNGCDATQQSMLTVAATNAQAGSQAAVQYLQTTGGDATFTQWFGAPTTDSVETAAQHYTKMDGLFGNVKYDCTFCASEAGTFAEVQPDDISTIYLCGYYWSAPACGTDSQQGTLIHEASHFTAIAGTDDIVYGQADAGALAASDPAKALMNADNHEYFEEAVFTACSASS